MARIVMQFLVLILPAIAVFAADDSTKTRQISAKFGSYDAERKLLSVFPSKESVSFVVDPKIQILMDDEPSTFKIWDLPEGSNLRLTIAEDKATVLTINAVGPTVGMTVTAIDRATRTLVARKGSRKSPLEIDEKATITDMKLKDRTYTLDQIKPGSRVYLFLTFDQTRIRSIRIKLAEK